MGVDGPLTGGDDSASDAEKRLESTCEFVGAVTHALKGLLNGLEGGVYLVESGQKKGDVERANRGLDMVKRNAAHLKNMVGSVLYYSKDRAPDRRAFDLQEMVQAAAKAVALAASQAGVEVEVRAEPGTIQADSTAMNAILVDLLEHGIDAVGALQEGPKRVTVEAQAGESGVQITVTCTGSRMDEEDRMRVIASHYTARGSDRSILWAFAARRVAQMQGGTFEIEVPISGGTCVRVSLPSSEALGE